MISYEITQLLFDAKNEILYELTLDFKYEMVGSTMILMGLIGVIKCSDEPAQ